jgi:hypothetical protein
MYQRRAYQIRHHQIRSAVWAVAEALKLEPFCRVLLSSVVFYQVVSSITNDDERNLQFLRSVSIFKVFWECVFQEMGNDDLRVVLELIQ